MLVKKESFLQNLTTSNTELTNRNLTEGGEEILEYLTHAYFPSRRKPITFSKAGTV
jgi:hypothetical protein